MNKLNHYVLFTGTFAVLWALVSFIFVPVMALARCTFAICEVLNKTDKRLVRLMHPALRALRVLVHGARFCVRACEKWTIQTLGGGK